MCQSSSYTAVACRDLNHPECTRSLRATTPSDAAVMGGVDYISDLPDACLGRIFHCLSSKDRKQCTLVCRRWLRVEGENHHRLSLNNAHSEIIHAVSSLFARFHSVTKLALRCDRLSVSLNDEALVLISIRCRSLTRLKIRGCRELTDLGMAQFAQNCQGLTKLSCGSCTFGSKGLSAFLEHCSSLQELSVKRLRGIDDGGAAEPIGPGAAGSSLKTICLKELYNGQCFGPLLIGAKKLKTLKLFRCLGDWDTLLESIVNANPYLVELHLGRLQLSDNGLAAMSNCSTVEVLHLVKLPECSSFGLAALAEHCTALRKLHIDGCRTNRIRDKGLIAVANRCLNLQELVLIGVNPTWVGMTEIASNCRNLERLALCDSDTIGDSEILCIADKCKALRKLYIKGCQISDHGLEVLAWGCPNLVKVKVKKCRNVTDEMAEWLKANRESLAVNLDSGETGHMDVNTSDSGAMEDGPDLPLGTSHVPVAVAPSRSNSRLMLFKSIFGHLAGRNLVPCTFRRRPNSNDGLNDSLS